jgi:hypothetical protein
LSSTEYHSRVDFKRARQEKIDKERCDHAITSDRLTFLKMVLVGPARRVFTHSKLRVATAIVAEMDHMGRRLGPDMDIDLGTRRVAEMAGVNHRTAMKALDWMIAEGYLCVVAEHHSTRARRLAPIFERWLEVHHTTSSLDLKDLDAASPEAVDFSKLEVVWCSHVNSLCSAEFANTEAAGVGEHARRIALLLEARKRPMSVEEIADATGITKRVVRSNLERLAGGVVAVSAGLFVIASIAMAAALASTARFDVLRARHERERRIWLQIADRVWTARILNNAIRRD